VLGNGQHHGFARAIEISRFFRDLILVDASEMNNSVGFIFISASKQFLFQLVCFQHSNLMQSVSSTHCQDF
jgi:heme/copper-type cytochrome/quinol oxidase subunit 4